MERSILMVLLLCSLLALGACAGKEPALTPDQQQCFDIAVKACDPAAQKACEGKSGYALDGCLESAVRTCKATAEDQCRKQLPSK